MFDAHRIIASYAVRRERAAHDVHSASIEAGGDCWCSWLAALLPPSPTSARRRCCSSTGFGRLVHRGRGRGARRRACSARAGLMAAAGRDAGAVPDGARARRSSDPGRIRDSGFQLTQSLIAIGRGDGSASAWRERAEAVLSPEAHTDFLFAVLAEGSGWSGSHLRCSWRWRGAASVSPARSARASVPVLSRGRLRCGWTAVDYPHRREHGRARPRASRPAHQLRPPTRGDACVGQLAPARLSRGDAVARHGERKARGTRMSRGGVEHVRAVS